MQRLYLFDIDLTLISTGGAGSHAMNLAFEEMFGVPSALSGIAIAGRSDTAILRDMLVAHRVPVGEFHHLVAAFQELYVEKLRLTLPEHHGRRLPGIPAVVEALRAMPGTAVGLATGNFRAGARVKLDHFGLWDLFLEGGFADDGEWREKLVAAGIERVRRAAGMDGSRVAVYVIGDTGHDVAAAKANGAVAVGVATGYEDVEALRGHGADIVFPDLGDVATVLAALTGDGYE